MNHAILTDNLRAWGAYFDGAAVGAGTDPHVTAEELDAVLYGRWSPRQEPALRDDSSAGAPDPYDLDDLLAAAHGSGSARLAALAEQIEVKYARDLHRADDDGDEPAPVAAPPAARRAAHNLPIPDFYAGSRLARQQAAAAERELHAQELAQLTAREGLVLLADVCKPLFNVNFKRARMYVANGTLPVPAFRLAGAGRGPLFVRRADIDALIEQRSKAARAASAALQDVAKPGRHRH